MLNFSLFNPYLRLGVRGQNRWIVPIYPKHSYRFLKLWRPYSLKSRIAWSLFLFMYRAYIVTIVIVVVRLLSGRFASICDNSCYSHVVYIGTAGLTQKYVVVTKDKSNKDRIYVEKVAVGEKARGAIEHEIRILSAIEGRFNFEVPKALPNHCHFGGLTQSYLDGRQSSSTFNINHAKQLLELADTEQSHTITKNDLVHQIKTLFGVSPLSSQIQNTVDHLFENRSEYSVPVCVEHADYVPWNILWVDGRYALVDWESSLLEGFPLFDAFHFFYTTHRFILGSDVCEDDIKKNLGYEFLRKGLKLSSKECDVLHLTFLLKKMNDSHAMTKKTDYDFYKRMILRLLKR